MEPFDECSWSDDEQNSYGSILRRTSIETRYSFNVRLNLFSFQTGNFTVRHPNNSADVRQSVRDSSDLREVSSNFWTVLIPDWQSFTLAPYRLSLLIKSIVDEHSSYRPRLPWGYFWLCLLSTINGNPCSYIRMEPDAYRTLSQASFEGHVETDRYCYEFRNALLGNFRAHEEVRYWYLVVPSGRSHWAFYITPDWVNWERFDGTFSNYTYYITVHAIGRMNVFSWNVCRCGVIVF